MYGNIHNFGIGPAHLQLLANKVGLIMHEISTRSSPTEAVFVADGD